MKHYCLLLFILVYLYSCKTNPNADRRYNEANATDTYRLHLTPKAGSGYHYLIRNESDIDVEIQDKKINNHNESLLGTSYLVDSGGLGNFVLTMQFDKIRVHSKTKDGESTIDMDDTTNAGPEAKIFAILRAAKLTATVTPLGEVKSLGGFNEIRDKAMAIIGPIDVRSRDMAAKQWNDIIGEGLVKKNMEQMFKIFPDSAVHVGETWSLSAKQKGEISVQVKTTYTLKSADDKIAVIESEGDLEKDSTANISFMGIGATASLKGTQTGKFEMETQTGMLLKALITTRIETTVEAMGRQIPVTLKNTVEINGRREK